MIVIINEYDMCSRREDHIKDEVKVNMHAELMYYRVEVSLVNPHLSALSCELLEL